MELDGAGGCTTLCMNQMPLNCSAEHVYVLWISEEEEKEGTPLAHWWRMGWVEEGGREAGTGPRMYRSLPGGR